MSSSTDPFVPQESRFGVTRSVLEAMLHEPPDVLIVQTHSHLVSQVMPLLQKVAGRCELRVHLSIEGDRERLPGLPPPASPLEKRLQAAKSLRDAGIRVVATMAPLFPLANPQGFFRRLADCVDAVVLDHFIQGDGSQKGSRTLKTDLPFAMAQIDPASLQLEYRERMAHFAREAFPGAVGVGADGFAGRFS